MSFVSLSGSDPTVTAEELHNAAKKAGFDIKPGSQDEADYLKFQNAFDAVASTVESLPDYVDPRLVPVDCGARKWTAVSAEDNPLNAWSSKCRLKATNPTSNKLAGKTLAIKANVSVAGAPLNVGTSEQLFEGKQFPISPIDATVVKRVLEAGGEILGTGVCENFSMAGLSVTADTGPVHNAWAPGYMTGGSSSGVASLISSKDVKSWRGSGRKLPFNLSADQMESEGVDMAVGGDQGGSIRMPANHSGIYGLKPTHGLVPYTGIAALYPNFDTTGPMTRSVEDTALLLEVMAGADGIDYRQSAGVPLPSSVPAYSTLLSEWRSTKQSQGEWTPTTAARGLRIGVLREGWLVQGMQPSVAAIVRSSADRFSSLGAEVVEVSVPSHLLAPAVWTVAGRQGMPSSLANHAPDLLSHTLPGFAPAKVDQDFFDYMAHRNPAVVNVLLNSAHLETKYGPSLTRKAHMAALRIRAEYDAAFEKNQLDVLLLPTNSMTAPKIPEVLLKGGTAASAMDMTKIMIGLTLNCCPFNLTGHPAMSSPCGWAESEDQVGKLPVGMQLVGRRFAEMDILKAALAWEVAGKGLDSLL